LIVVLVAIPLKQILEHISHGGVLRSLIKSQVACLTEIFGELHRVALAQNLNGGGQLLLFDSFIFVPLVVSLEPLPRKHASEEVHDNITNAFHVISAGLLNSQVSVDGGIAGGSSQILSFSVGNVLSISLNISLGQSEVKNKNFVGSFIQSNAEVIWLDISVNEMSVVNVFNSGNHLINQHEHCFERELSESLIKERFQRRPH